MKGGRGEGGKTGGGGEVKEGHRRPEKKDNYRE